MPDALLSYGLNHGGPPTMIWGWAIVGGLVLFAGLSMAEICSAFPTAGGLYYWSAKLAPGKSGPIWSWFTGWFNLLGQVAVTAGITFGCGFSVGEFIYLVSGNALVDRSNRHVVLLTAISAAASRSDQHLRGQHRRAVQQGLGVVAPHWRRGHRRAALHRAALAQLTRAGASSSGREALTPSGDFRASPFRSTSSCSACWSPSTPSRGMTRRPT